MPSGLRYTSMRDWPMALARLSRIPVVFLLSMFGSYCAFQDGSALFGQGGNGYAGNGGGRVRVAVWDADLMPGGRPLSVRGHALAGFGDAVNPDVLVVYDVPDFAMLLKLRTALHLYGYSAVMSNFFCAGTVKGQTWPAEIAILSRYPIDEAIQFDPPTDQLKDCARPAPFTDGPVAASHRRLKVPQNFAPSWPRARGRPLPGPGFLTARIDSARVVVVGVRVARPAENPHAPGPAINAMRQAITASLGAWIWHEKDLREDDHFLAAGDFGVGEGTALPAGNLAPGNADDGIDGAASILTQGVINGGAATRPGSGDTPGGLRMIDLTRAVLVRPAEPAEAPHDARIYLWSRQPGVFGSAERTAIAFGSRGYPLVVASSGGTCAIDPALTWMRRSPTFAGLSRQVFTASKSALRDQLAALRARKAVKPWVVSLDLDDVVIDNSPFLYDVARSCQLPSVSAWNRWISSGQARLLPGARAFLDAARAAAKRGHGRILIFTKRRPDQAAETIALLKRLGVVSGPNDPIVHIEYGVTPQSRLAAWRKATSRGDRIVLVVGNSTGQFPDDPKLPVGGTPRSCPNPRIKAEDKLRLFGPQTARFGVCYFLIPVHVP